MSLSIQRRIALAAIGLAALAASACDADFSQPDTREEISLQTLPEPVRFSIETQFPSALLAKVEKRVRAGRDLYLAFGAGEEHGERILFDSRGKIIGWHHGANEVRTIENAFGRRSSDTRLAQREAVCSPHPE
jgi:hypothetical protein